MPLDYSKWDNIELSDDEDIEVHPNIDKKSFIRWRQADIHRKRDERRSRITELKDLIAKSLKNASDGNANNSTSSSVDPSQLEKWEKELSDLEKEEKQKLTVDNLCKPGFNKTSVNKTSSTATAVNSSSTCAADKKTKKKVIEVLNPGAGSNDGEKKESEKVAAEEEEDEDDDDSNQIISNPYLLEYGKTVGFDKSFEYISKNPFIVSQENSDEIMAASFTAEMAGDAKLAKNFVRQALSLQYSVSLGRDGVGLFFARMKSSSPQALKMFEDDVERTYKHIQSRSKVLLENRKQNRASLFDNAAGNKNALQAIATLPQNFRDALLSEDLEKVNMALATMSELEAKRCLRICKESGVLDLEDDDIVVTEKELSPETQEGEQKEVADPPSERVTDSVD